MIIAFLQGGIENPILPNLLDFDSTKYSKTMYYLPRGSTEYVCETNWYFISNHKQCKSEIEKGVVNDSSTAELVYHFFNYYLNVFNVSKIISLKHGGFCDKLNSEDTIAFSIVDPFQIEHNPGQSVKSNSMSYKIIWLKFKDIIDKIENGEWVF